MSRRAFLKKSGVIAGGILMSDNALFASLTSKKIRLGIVGCGDRGSGIINTLKEFLDIYEITAVCDSLDFRLQNAKKKQASSSAKGYSDYRKLIEDKKVDAVVIATPLNSHFEIAKFALEGGKHVYLEKAMTFDDKQALELVSLVAKYPKQVVQVGHQYRSSPLYYRVKEMIAYGRLGKVTQVDCRWDRNASWRRPVPDPSLERRINWRMYKEYSGGLAAELLSHQIDFINWAFDTQPDQVYATGGVDFYKDGRETFDNIQATLRYQKEGIIGNFGATCSNERDGFLFKIKGSKGSISLLTDQGIFYPEKETKKELETVDGVTGATKIAWNNDGGIPILKEKTKDGTWYALKDFYTSIKNNTLPDSNIYTGAKTAIAVHLINTSAYTNSIQQWKPEYNVIK